MTSVLAEIDAACAAFAREHNIPGLIAGVVQEGRLAHVTALGQADIEADRPVTPATAFRIASMTKSTTALAILLLRDQGRLALDAPLADYVPQFAAVAPATRDSRSPCGICSITRPASSPTIRGATACSA